MAFCASMAYVASGLGIAVDGATSRRRASLRALQKVYPGFTVGIQWSDDPTFHAQYSRITEGLCPAGLLEGVAKTD